MERYTDGLRNVTPKKLQYAPVLYGKAHSVVATLPKGAFRIVSIT